jgi:nitrogen fixation protein FixH
MIRSTPTSTPRREFTGRHMLFAMLGFFGVIVAVNVLMAVIASGTWTGLVVANSYVASQEFQAREDAARHQRELGWRATLRWTQGRVSLFVSDGTGAPVDLGNVTLQVNRPVGGREDRVLDMGHGAGGSYEAQLALPPGVWELTITAPKTLAGPFRLHKRVSVEGSAGS